jgi:hypothetical protein
VAWIAIMISTDTDLMTFKLRANGVQMINVTKSKITKKENLIVVNNAIIPILDKTPIHFLDIFKRSTCIPNDIGMGKMGV